MRAYLLVPYEIVTVGTPWPIRRCVMDRATADIRADGGYWEEAELDGNQALVCVRANASTLARVRAGLPVTQIDDPASIWTPSRMTPINRGGEVAWDSGRMAACKTVAQLHRDVLDDQQSGELQRTAEALMQRLAHESYIRLHGMPWPDAAKLLGYLASLGYGLNRISTGTFPTVTTVRDSGVRTTENPLSNGGKWTNPAQSGSSNLQINAGGTAIVSTQGTSDVDASAFWNNAADGADCEVYWTMTTRPNRFTYGYLGLIDSPGTATMDGYFFLTNMETTTNNLMSRIDSNALTQLGASYTQTHSDGDRTGFERLGTTLTHYRYTGGSWASIGSRTDATYSASGNAGMGDKASATAGAYNDFVSGQVVAAPVDPPAMGGHIRRVPLRPRIFAPGLAR